MNRLPATICGIETSRQISLVDLTVGEDLFSCVIIETPESASYLRIGNTVTLLFKETEVSIAKDWQGQISLRNRMAAEIRKIDGGGVLSRIVLDYQGKEIISIITTRSVRKLRLQTGDSVTAMVKANEVSIMSEEPR